METGKIKSYDLPYILEAREILNTAPERQFTITELALELGINSFKLQLGFKEIFKTTIHQYRLDLRLSMAKKLLDATDMTIAEVAYKTGFDSRDGFARSFRKRFKQSPREWRKVQDMFINNDYNNGALFQLSLPLLN